MTVIVIRKHSRFAVCRKARVRHSRNREAEALLVELSIGGCRLGNLPDGLLGNGQSVELEVDGAKPVPGTVRWTVDGSLGLMFDKPLHTFELDQLIRLCRGEHGARAAMRA